MPNGTIQNSRAWMPVGNPDNLLTHTDARILLH